MAQSLVALQPAACPHQQAEPVIEPIPKFGQPSWTACATRPTRSPAESRPGGGRSPRPCPRHRANEMPGATAPARSTNNVAAAESALSRTSSDGTGQSCSSASRSPSRLVATTVTVADCCRIDADHVGGRVEDVLAVVEHQQALAPLQRRGHAVGHTQSRLLRDAEDRGHRLRHRGRIAHGGQFDDPHPVGEAVGQPGRDLQRESGLADAADADQRHQPMRFQRRLQVGQFSLASHEAGGGRAQVSWSGLSLRAAGTRCAGRALAPERSRPVSRYRVIALLPNRSGRTR